MAVDDTEPSSSPALAASGAVKASSCGRRTTTARHRQPSPAMSRPALQHHVSRASSSMAMIVSRLELESNSELQGSDQLVVVVSNCCRCCIAFYCGRTRRNCRPNWKTTVQPCRLPWSKWLLCEYQISGCSSIAGLIHVSELRPSSPSRNCTGQLIIEFGSPFYLLSVLSLQSSEEVSVVFMTNGEAVTLKVSQPSVKASMATTACSTKSASFNRLYRA
ncbi:hypothetical protein VPH35_011088 [Triticum aestivum]|uniref:uncharacterized protein n=1 Tax=Triticum aestivum TaxID=4565 RepID=UPI0008450B93|nr:uncharacterized protein LOC123144892 [Triticum aestivum]XP_044420092.1 uncharacterized protein LOC123144892 [Triticum aestivum]